MLCLRDCTFLQKLIQKSLLLKIQLMVFLYIRERIPILIFFLSNPYVNPFIRTI